MRRSNLKPLNGAWSEKDNAWVSETLYLTGNCWLEVTLPSKGRMVIKKAEKPEGPFPKALITKWEGPEFRTRIYGSTMGRYLKICLTTTPTRIQTVDM